ncbi:hypothetical protein Q3G72_004568 [Acer saccharum]|nr:hypothetical protein Q3G72_004568 [Acer saccharum]
MYSRERTSDVRWKEGRADFRVNLVSIFVDNLNPKVDTKCLWAVFKVFGKVRDVFLLGENSIRRSRYAFIRFGSREEAQKVANMTNMMHVYGWPISSKVMTTDWDKLKKDGVRSMGRNQRGADQSKGTKDRSTSLDVRRKTITHLLPIGKEHMQRWFMAIRIMIMS